MNMNEYIPKGMFSAVIGGVIGIGLALPALAASPFYKGKRVTILIGYSPGGTIAANYVGKATAPDDTTACWGTFPLKAQFLGDEALKVDLRKFNYIAGTPGNQVLYTRTNVQPGIKSALDEFKAKGLVIGGLRVSSNKDLSERLALDILGVKHKYVTGFKGNSRTRAAVQQGIVNTYLEGLPSYLGVAVPTMVKTGMVTPIYEVGIRSASDLTMDRDSEVKEVPTLVELHERKYDKKPSGIAYESYVALTSPSAESQRVLAFAPGSPKAAVQALRIGARKMEKDAAFKANMLKVIKYRLPVYPSERAEIEIRTALSVSDTVKTFLKNHMKAGKRLSRKAKKK